VHRAAGVHGVPRGGRGHGLRPGLPAAGAALGGLRQEGQAVHVHLPQPASVRRRGGAVQQRPLLPRPPGAHRGGRDVRQRSHLRHLPPQPRHRTTHLHQPEPPHHPGRHVSSQVSEIMISVVAVELKVGESCFAGDVVVDGVVAV
jgi:hypothetical protein